MEPFWMSVRETNLRQGDLLPGCWIPDYPADFAEQTDEAQGTRGRPSGSDCHHADV